MNAYSLGQLAEARTDLEKAVALTGSEGSRNGYQILRVYAALSRIHAEQGRPADADEMARRAERLRPQALGANPSSNLSQSTAMVVNNSPGQSQQLAVKQPSSTQPPPLTEAQKKRERQLEDLLANSLNDGGTALARSHDYASALPFFRQAAEADPDLQPVMRNLGLAAFHRPLP